MANEKRLIDANALPYENQVLSYDDEWCLKVSDIEKAPTVDAVEVQCHCCDCYHLLNSKNSFGLYFFCGHGNGLKNIRNSAKDFCPYAERRTSND